MKNKVKKLIENYVFQTLVEFKSSFKWNEFKSLSEVSGWSGIIAYVEKHKLPFIGQGSSRKTYALPNTKYVLKIAKNTKGIAQNQAEVDIYTNPRTKNIVAKIFDFDPEYVWLVSETVKEFKNNGEFKKNTGIDLYILMLYYPEMVEHGEKWFDVVVNKLEIESNSYRENITRRLEAANEVNKHPLSKNFANAIQTGNLIPGDLAAPQHWGITSDGRVVILDYGFTEDVWKKHYS